MTLLINKNARREYEIQETYVAGVVLSGPEVKSLRLKKGSLRGSYVKIIQGEAFLINAQINPYEYADNREYEPKQTRKLLLKKKEILKLAEAVKKKNTALVALEFFTEGRRIKLKLGLGRGKQQHEKREDLKKKAIKRDVARELKFRNRG